MIVIVFGLPGSGKSYFAARLAGLLNAEYINSDKIRMGLFKKRTYSAKEKQQVYDVMLNLMLSAAERGHNVVLDATFHKEGIREKFAAAAGLNNTPVFIETTASEHVIRHRLSQKRENSEADYEVYQMLRQQWEPMSQPHLVLQSTNDNIAELLKRSVVYLQIKNDNNPDK